MLGQHALLSFGGAALLGLVASTLFARSLGDRDLARQIQRVVHGENTQKQARTVRSLALAGLRLLGTFVQRFSIFSEKDLAELQRTARGAGFAPDSTVPMVIGGKLILMVSLPSLTFLLTRNLHSPWPLVLTCAAVGLGIFGPNAAINYARRQRLRSLRLGLSDALDLLVVCAEAGLGLESAIDRVAIEMRHSNSVVAGEFDTLSQDLRLSSDRGAALMRMGDRTGLESFQRLTLTLSQTLRYGTPLGQALRLLAVEMRNDRMLNLEEKAARLPTLMMIPLAIFILPCLFIVVAGPAALRIMAMMG